MQIVLAKVVIVNDQGEILVLRRSLDDPIRPGGWDFPGGRVEAGEASEAAVVREAQEEAGITLKNSRLVWSETHEVEGGTLVWLIYLQHVIGRPEVRLSSEHDVFAWQQPAAFIAGDPHPKQRVLLTYLQAHNLLSSPGNPVVTARALVRNNKGELLILRRSQTDPYHAGEWDLPGGRVDDAELVEHAVVRETAEEAGLALRRPVLVYGASAKRRDGTGTWLFYIEQVAARVRPVLSYEHDGYKWITFADLPDYTDYNILLDMHRFVTKHGLFS